MQLTTITPETTAALTKLIDNATQPTTSSPVLPAALVHIIDVKNNVLFSHGSSPDTRPTSSSIAIIQSLSKIIGAIAYQQLVERGLATLDDPTTITTYLPELAAQKVLTGYSTDSSTGKKLWRLEERTGDITARMLLNHTYGGGHTYFNTLLLDYIRDQGEDVWNKTNEATNPYGILLASPLLWQPGTHTNYGQGLDWIAVLIERISGKALHAFLQENIFSPLDLQEIGMEPVYGGVVTALPHNAGKFWPRKMRSEIGFATLDAASPDVVRRDDAFPQGAYHTGCLGTGLVASAADYTHLLSVLLPQNAGVDPVTGYRVLSAESVREITSPQLPAHLRNDSRSLPVSDALPILLPVDLSSPYLDPEGSYGLGCGVQGADRVLQRGSKGRREGSVYWYGATNCEMWVDGASGIVVAAWGNYYPWNEKAWTDFVAEVEGIVYKALRAEG
jgi:CubicO group peptidase (beta-lactamase class C family)